MWVISQYKTFFDNIKKLYIILSEFENSSICYHEAKYAELFTQASCMSVTEALVYDYRSSLLYYTKERFLKNRMPTEWMCNWKGLWTDALSYLVRKITGQIDPVLERSLSNLMLGYNNIINLPVL